MLQFADVDTFQKTTSLFQKQNMKKTSTFANGEHKTYITAFWVELAEAKGLH